MRVPARRSWPSRRRPPRPPTGWPSNRLDIAPTAPSSLALSFRHAAPGTRCRRAREASVGSGRARRPCCCSTRHPSRRQKPYPASIHVGLLEHRRERHGAPVRLPPRATASGTPGLPGYGRIPPPVGSRGQRRRGYGAFQSQSHARNLTDQSVHQVLGHTQHPRRLMRAQIERLRVDHAAPTRLPRFIPATSTQFSTASVTAGLHLGY